MLVQCLNDSYTGFNIKRLIKQNNFSGFGFSLSGCLLFEVNKDSPKSPLKTSLSNGLQMVKNANNGVLIQQVVRKKKMRTHFIQS